MIIGNGDMASVLKDKKGILYFASGVSNSKETRESEYKREEDLLLKQDRNLHIIYFSSLSIFYKDTRYTKHKKDMESLIRKFPRYTILRLGNITWGDNPNTIINNFRGKISRGEKLEIEDTYRYILEKDELLHWINLIPNWNCEMNITGRRMKVSDIVDEYCRVKPNTKHK
jgi:hypothetical protein